MAEETTPAASEHEVEGILSQIESPADEPATDELETKSEESSPANSQNSKSIDAMLNVGMNIQIVLGYSRMPIADLLNLSRGSVIELDKKIGESVDVIVNQSLVARGDLIKVGDNRIGISLTEIVKDYIAES